MHNLYVLIEIRGYSDKSLARPECKEVTANNLGIYGQHSQLNSVNFIAHFSISNKPLKKFRKFSVQPDLRDRNDLHVGRKMATFQFFFSPGNRC